MIQEHTQTFIPILDRTASFSPLLFSLDPAPPQQKKLKRDRSLSPSSRLTVPHIIEAPKPISSKQQASIQKIAISTSPFWDSDKNDILPVQNFLKCYTPAKNFIKYLREQSHPVQKNFAYWYSDNGYPDVDAKQLWKHLEKVVNQVSNLQKETSPLPGPSRTQDTIRRILSSLGRQGTDIAE